MILLKVTAITNAKKNSEHDVGMLLNLALISNIRVKIALFQSNESTRLPYFERT